ncbi:hypothetical protein ACOSQ3_015676 [Xanthoceras sorbifolium]
MGVEVAIPLGSPSFSVKIDLRLRLHCPPLFSLCFSGKSFPSQLTGVAWGVRIRCLGDAGVLGIGAVETRGAWNWCCRDSGLSILSRSPIRFKCAWIGFGSCCSKSGVVTVGCVVVVIGLDWS